MAINKIDALDKKSQAQAKAKMDREKKEQERKEAETKRKEEQRVKEATKKANDEIMGSYKRTVFDSYLKAYADNYGGSFDKRTLVDSFTFDYKIDKNNNLVPSFTFNQDGVRFKSDFNRDFKKFNENAVSNYDGRDTQINPEIQDIYNFNSRDERIAYQESGGQLGYQELTKVENEFIPTSDASRYGTFNRINKLAGYTPMSLTTDKAKKQSESLWSKIKSSVANNVFKKMKL